MSAETVKALAEKRVRRQKIFIAVGSVVLLAVLGFQLPKLLGGKGNDASVVSPVPTSAVGAVPVVPAGKLPNTDRVVVVRDSNQLISFGLFKSKDPFVQQLDTNPQAPAPTPVPAPAEAPGTPEAPGAGAGGAPTIVPPATTTVSSPPGTPGAPATTPGTTTPAAPAPVPTDALIATNGVCERVSVKGTFPTSENVFRLVSVAKDGKSVEVGVVGGSFDSGQPTALLKLGEKLTLVNTADGTRYEIVLKSGCTLQAPAGTSTSPQAVPTTPIAPAPAPPPTTTTATTTTTTTATTPIVTDSLDPTPPPSQ
jgi:hypothetical protein